MQRLVLLFITIFMYVTSVAADQDVFIKDDLVSISVKENASTGHRWYLKTWNEALLMPERSIVQNTQSDMLGAPYTRKFEFSIVKKNIRVPIASTIVFILMGPDGAIKEDKAFTVRLG